MGAWEITLKDLRLIAKDRAALCILIALPIVFIAILGMSTGQLLVQRDELKLIKLGFVDEDQTELSGHVFNALADIGGLVLEKVSNRNEARRGLQDGRHGLVIFLGNGFQAKTDELEMGDVLDAQHGVLSEGLAALNIEVECGSTYEGVQDLVKYVVFSAVMHVVAPEVSKRSSLFARAMTRAIEKRQEEADAKKIEKPPRKPVKSGSGIIYQTLVPAFLVLFAFFLVNVMASSFINERVRGTLRRIQTTQISPFQLLVGKTLPFFFVSLIQSLLLFISGKFMFGMSWGVYPGLLLPVILFTSLSATGLGLIVATLVRTESQVASYSTFLVVVLAGISGCYLPRDWLPEIMKTISLITPHAWALIAYQELLTREHPNIGLVLFCCGVLASIGATCFALGWWRFRHVEYPT